MIMKKILFLLFVSLSAFGQRNGLIDADTTTRPKAGLSALAFSSGQLKIIRNTGNSYGVITSNNTYVNPSWLASIALAKVTGLDTSIFLRKTVATATYVAKEAGKGLSSNDYTTAEKNKLAGIAIGATANSTDAQLRDRSTHTGTQAQNTVTGLVAALSEKSDTSHTHTTAKISDWTAAWAARFAAQSTSGLTEGSNLYYTDARVGTYGDARYGRLESANSWTDNNTFGGSASPTHAVTLPQGAQWTSYNTADQTTNFERVRGYWNGPNYSIVAERGGTGSGRSIYIGGSNTVILGGTNGAFSVSVNGVNTQLGILRVSDGVSSANGSQFSLLGTYSNTSGQANGFLAFPTINQSGTAGYRSIFVSPYEQSVGTGSKLLLDLGINSAANGAGTHTSRYNVDNQGNVFANGYMLLGTTTNAGYKLDLNGTMRVTGQSTLNATSIASLDMAGSTTRNINRTRIISNDESAGITISSTNSTGSVIFMANGGEVARFSSERSLLVGRTTEVQSSILTLESTTRGFLPPRMTTAQINAIASPAAGLVAYNTDLSTLCFYNGTAWQKVTSTNMN